MYSGPQVSWQSSLRSRPFKLSSFIFPCLCAPLPCWHSINLFTIPIFPTTHQRTKEARNYHHPQTNKLLEKENINISVLAADLGDFLNYKRIISKVAHKTNNGWADRKSGNLKLKTEENKSSPETTRSLWSKRIQNNWWKSSAMYKITQKNNKKNMRNSEKSYSELKDKVSKQNIKPEAINKTNKLRMWRNQ